MNALQAADVPPTANQRATILGARQIATGVMARWNALRTTELAALNERLRSAGLQAITIP